MTKTNTYHVKFTHQYARLQDNIVNQSSAIQYITETVDAEWELDAWVDVFTYIYAHYEVIGCVEVTHINKIGGSKMTNNIKQEWQLFFDWCKANDRNVKDGKALLDYMAQLKSDKK